MKKLLRSIHWTTSEEMLFTSEHKYSLILDKDFPLAIKFYQFTTAHPVIPNYHDFFEISYFYSGKGVYHIADSSYNILPGAIALIHSGIMHHADADPEDSLRSASIYFMPELVYQPGSTPYEYGYLMPFISHTREHPPFMYERDLGVSISKPILEMYETLNNAQRFHQLRLKLLLCDLLIVFMQKLLVPDANAAKATETPMNRIRRLDGVFSFIHAKYATSITLAQLARAAYMSPAYFCRFFKGVTGLSPVEYVLRFRIDKAKELLINSDASVTEISFQVGFNSQSYFDRVFQRYTSVSPKTFRQTYSPGKYFT